MHERTTTKQSGFSLIELMIAMIIFLIAISAIYGVIQVARLQRDVVNTKTDSMKGGRIAMSYIRRDAVNAGLSYHNVGGIVPDNFANKLFSTAADTDTERDFLTAIMAGNNVNTNSLNPTGKTDVVAFVSRDIDFNDGNSINYSSATAAGGIVNLQTATGAAQECNPFDLYLFETATTQVVGLATSVSNGNLIQLSPNDPLGVNQAADGTGTNQSLLISGSGTFKKINLISYSVNKNGALVRTIYGNNTNQAANEQIQAREIIYGVKDFQVVYLMSDGTTTDDPSNGNNGQTNQKLMNQVVEIQITLTIVPKDPNNSASDSVIVINEVISCRNLRYKIS